MNKLKLIATDECVMDDGGKSLTIGREYPATMLVTQLYVIDDDWDTHYFDLNPLSEDNWARFFKLVK